MVAPDEKFRPPKERQHVNLKGHAIKFVHSGVQQVVEALNQTMEARVADLLQKVPLLAHCP